MDETVDVESWRKSLMLPKLNEDVAERLNAKPRIRQLLARMVDRVVPVDKARRVRCHLIFECLSDPRGNFKSQKVQKEITNAKKRQMLENKLAVRYEELLKCEIRAREGKDKMKAITKEIRKLSQNIEEKEKKSAFLALYKEEQLVKLKDQIFLLSFLEKIHADFQRRRNLVGKPTECPSQVELKEAVKDCQNELKIGLSRTISLNSESSSAVPAGLSELKSELCLFYVDRLKTFPWTSILQYTLSLQEEISSKLCKLQSDRSGIFCEDLEEMSDTDCLKLIPYCNITSRSERKVNSLEDHCEIIKRKCEEVSAQLSELREELRELFGNIKHEKPKIDKEIIQLVALIPKCPEKLWESHKRVKQIDIPQETLITSVRCLCSSVSKELKLFADLPLISVEYLSPHELGRTESYKCLSQFERIPLHSMKFGSWAALLEESCETQPHKQALEVCQQIQYLMPLKHALEIVSEEEEKMGLFAVSSYDDGDVSKTETEKFKTIMHKLYNSFVDIFALHEQNYYKLPEILEILHSQPLLHVIPESLHVEEKTVGQWLYILKFYYESCRHSF